ncbi:hypothetical protein IMZ48_40710 [Candidatus Bathyarchaeota archaeon]|nr:hypothetical protein [Candidatus Bathyarchaeota archaeon]
MMDQGRRVALEVLGRAMNRPNFGKVDILLGGAKARHQKKLSAGSAKHHSLLEAIDFDEDFDRAERGEKNIRMLKS